MSDNPEKNSITDRFHSGINVNSLDIHKTAPVRTIEAPKTANDLPPVTIAQPEPVLRRTPEAQPEPVLRRNTEAQPVKTASSEEFVARPNKSKQTAGQELSNMVAIPEALASGYYFSRRGSLNAADIASAKLPTLSDHAIPQQLATDFNISRDQLHTTIKSRFEAAAAKVDEHIKAKPDLMDEGYRFEFQKETLPEDLVKKLYKPGDLGEIIEAVDKVPKNGLTPELLKQVSEYTDHLGQSPMMKDEGLVQFSTAVDDSARKFSEALAQAGPDGASELTEAGRAANAAEKEFYASLKNLRENLGSKKYFADEEMRKLMAEKPDLFKYGNRFEFDPTISPEQVAELKRPSELKGLLSQIEKTHAPASDKLITSQGEHLAALKGLSENPIIKNEGLSEMAGTFEKHAGQVIESRTKAFALLGQEQSSFMKKSLLTLGAGVATNAVIDRVFFKDQTVGMLTHLSNIGAPAILLSDMSPKVKVGVIVGSHLLARLAEKPSGKHLERSNGSN